MKRVKKGYERHGEARWFERAGALCIEQCRGPERHTVVLSTRECEALGITAALEDVPEPKTPGERLGDVLGRMGFHGATRQQLELAAAALGIKPEGAS